MITPDEYIRRNVVKIVTSSGRLAGTGFFLDNDHCITCHHVICNLDDIKIEHDNKIYDTEWLDLSDPTKDVAVLYVKDCPIKPLLAGTGAYSEIPIKGYGFHKDMQSGTWFEGKLSNIIELPSVEEEVSGNNKWNIKPSLNVTCYQLKSTFRFDNGSSGSPVCHANEWRVVGMITSISAKDYYEGYMIPIDVINKLFAKRKTSTPAPTINTAKIIEGNIYFDKKRV